MDKKRRLTILFFIFIFALFFLPHADNDFGWHYKLGESIVKEGQVLAENRFAYLLPDHVWANPTFLYDILIFVTYNLAGFLGLSILGAVVFTSLIGAIFLQGKKFPLAFKIPLMLLAIFLSWGVLNMGFRSQIFSLLFTFLTLSILSKSTEPKKLLLLTPLFFIWANTHAGFFLAPLLLVIFWVATGIKVVLKTFPWRSFITLSAIFGLAILATLINPFTFRIYEEILRHWNSPLNTLIAEWVPPAAGHVMPIFLLSGGFIFWSFFVSDIPHFFEAALIGLFSVFALRARRNLPLFYLTYLFLGLNVVQLKLKEKVAAQLELLLIPALLVLAVGLSLPSKILDVFSFDYCGGGYVGFPCEAVSFMKDKEGGNVFNMYEWGGFLVWQIPQMKVFVDGRMPAWQDPATGKSPYTLYLDILQAKEGWAEKLEAYGTDYLMIGPGTFLDLAVQEEGPENLGYQELYRDSVAVIYKKF